MKGTSGNGINFLTRIHALLVSGLYLTVFTFSLSATANPNPDFEGFSAPGGWTLTVNGSEDPVLINEGDILDLELSEHARDFCGTQPCIQSIRWDWFTNDTYYQPFGNVGDGWSVRFRATDLETSCRNFQDYNCEVEVVEITNTGNFCSFPRLINISVLQVFINGELFEGVPNIGLPYIIGPDMYVNLDIGQCDPVAILEYVDPLSNPGADPYVFHFSGERSYDPDEVSAAIFTQPPPPSAGIVNWVWDFGDGATGFGSTPTHAYVDDGEYDVTLEVTDNDGATDEFTTTVYIDNSELFADFFASQDLNDPLRFFFDGGLSFSSSGFIDEWYWEFGDGTSTSGPDSEFEIHDYAQAGYYQVYLEIYDEQGNSASAAQNIYAGQEIAPRTLPRNQWIQFSIPRDSVNRALVDYVNAPLTAANYGAAGEWIAYEFTNGAYNALQADTLLQQGRGYWIISDVADTVALSVPDPSFPTSTQFFSNACPDFRGCFNVPLETLDNDFQWNLIGYPFELGQSLNNTQVVTFGGVCSAGCTVDDAEANNVMFNKLFRYNPALDDYDELTTADSVEPWDAYWVPALEGAHTNGASWLVPYP